MHKFYHSGAKPFLQEKLGVLREIVSKTNFPYDSHVLLTQEKRLTNSGLWYLWKIFYENHCHDDAQISPQWGEAIFRRRIESFVKNCSQNQSPRWVTCLLTQAKSLTNAVIVISVENVYKTAVLKTHKYSHSGAKPFLERKLWVLWANVFYTNIPDESHVNSHRRKALQTQKCDMCGKYFSKITVLKMHKFCHSGAEPALRGKLRVQESHVIQRNKIKEIHVKDIFQSLYNGRENIVHTYKYSFYF